MAENFAFMVKFDKEQIDFIDGLIGENDITRSQVVFLLVQAANSVFSKINLHEVVGDK